MNTPLNFTLNIPLEIIKKAFENKKSWVKIHLFGPNREILIKESNETYDLYFQKDILITKKFYLLCDTDISYKYILSIDKLNNIRIQFPFYYNCYYYKNTCDNSTKCFFKWTIYNNNNNYSQICKRFISIIKHQFFYYINKNTKKISVYKFEQNIKDSVGYFLFYKSISIKNSIESYLNLLFNPKNIYGFKYHIITYQGEKYKPGFSHIYINLKNGTIVSVRVKNFKLEYDKLIMHLKNRCNGKKPLISEEKIIINQLGKNLMLLSIFYRIPTIIKFENIKKIDKWYNFKLLKIKEELEK